LLSCFFSRSVVPLFVCSMESAEAQRLVIFLSSLKRESCTELPLPESFLLLLFCFMFVGSCCCLRLKHTLFWSHFLSSWVSSKLSRSRAPAGFIISLSRFLFSISIAVEIYPQDQRLVAQEVGTARPEISICIWLFRRCRSLLLEARSLPGQSLPCEPKGAGHSHSAAGHGFHRSSFLFSSGGRTGHCSRSYSRAGL
jgi:hypothetical protein